MHVDARCFPRYLFFASVQITDSDSDSLMNARTSDISLGGCYLDTMNPFHEGTPLRVRITHHGQSIDANARVVHSRPNVGMGLRFEQVDSRQVPILDRWIEDLQTA